MRDTIWTRVIACVLMAALILPVAAIAQERLTYDPEDEIPAATGVERALTKLGRGLSNVMFGWAEIPVTFDKKLKQGKPLGYLLGVVPVLGTARAVMRTTTGVFEAVTFPFSDRDVNYEPILEPEFLF
ncbi:MAG TPA: exosortase system-associated protein, TIGR04073 family [Candidatus Hydrogenedentes bacterium]|nr:exosortase system-associated protein, TIGR04073 family [Candidatus Hydrogenedentota bacterium]HOL76837.1 exosortase system-associated protein, TIGR04073 family [Candidatus Hydrogenedentota bacterium]HPO86221.1 exosortase system-associated protein, TIGR04073 family [Candidatus Hydrogenedentota bacterium]